jgi:dihydrofolate reductase
MSKIIVDVAISLDGFMAGDNRGPKNPLGDGGEAIHNWMFRQKAFFRSHGMEGGEEDGADGKLIEEVFARTGAYIMGKRMFEEGEANWPEDLFKKDVYVLTHEKREPWVQKGATTFYFINNGIESALEKARESANGRDIRIQGGGDTVQQFFNAGLVDELTVHISPVFLGSGIRLFDNIDKTKYTIEISEVIHSPATTHINYKLNKTTA